MLIGNKQELIFSAKKSAVRPGGIYYFGSYVITSISRRVNGAALARVLRLNPLAGYGV